MMKALKQPFRHYISNYDWSLVLAMLCGSGTAALLLLGYFDAWFPMYPGGRRLHHRLRLPLPVMIAYEGGGGNQQRRAPDA